MFLCRQRLFLVGPPSEIFGAKKGGAAFFSFSVHMDAGPHAGVEKDVFSGGWNSFSFVFLKKKRPKPNVEINATFPRIPNPQPDVFPPIKPPPPYTTSHHQHPPTPHLQIPSVSFSILQSHPPIHPAPTRYRSTRRSSSSARPPAKPRRMPSKASRICSRRGGRGGIVGYRGPQSAHICPP